MDYKHITREAGPAAARIIETGEALALMVETAADESGLYELIETRAATIEEA